MTAARLVSLVMKAVTLPPLERTETCGPEARGCERIVTRIGAMKPGPGSFGARTFSPGHTPMAR